MTENFGDDVDISRKRRIWEYEEILRNIYFSWYNKIKKYIKAGRCLEVGSGIGNFKDFFPDILALDIIPSEYIDICTDARCLPFMSNCFDTIVCIDTLHHIVGYTHFLKDALRTLKKKGRLILFEPYNSLVSSFLRKKFHYEDTSKYPLAQMVIENAKNIGFSLIFSDYLEFFAYPLSGGFFKKNIVPLKMIRVLYSLERTLSVFKSICAFKYMAIFEKQ